MSPEKIVPFQEAPALFDRLRQAGKRIVQCHGTWDLLHPGHVHHLEEARALGDLLVVTATADHFVNKGPGRPFFNDQLRARSLAALSCVDYVVMVPYAAAVEAIECVRPAVYCKGKEYADPRNDPTGNIADDIATVTRHGGQVHYLGSVVFSSTKLINNFFDHLAAPAKMFCQNLAKSCTPEEFRAAVESFADLRVLLIGDIIFDRYSTVKMQGLTSKNRIISGRFLTEETHSGGALAVYHHLKQFTREVKFISLVGTEPWVDAALKSRIDPAEDWIVRDPQFTTVVKQRFNEPQMIGKELVKLFAVNFINDVAPSAQTQTALVKTIAEHIGEFDLVVVADFGHGLMQNELRALVQELARFMSLNCQTNSNNHGFNIISRQYDRAHAFSLDEQELLLSCARRPIEFMHELENLRRSFSARYAWLTRGSVETIGLHNAQQPSLCMPFETTVVDTVGAGDAFFSVASLSAARGLPIELGTFIGQLAGAQAVKTVGNQQPISKQGPAEKRNVVVEFLMGTAAATDLESIARSLRGKLVEMSHRAGYSHLASALSCVDILVAAYWNILRIDARDPETKRVTAAFLAGHAASALYATLAERGFFPKDWLDSFGHDGSPLAEQPSPACAPGVELATGSLGHGLPVGAGMALSARILHLGYRVLVIMSDGECNEGSVWEAALFAAAQRLQRITVVIDYNKWQATGRSNEVMALDPLCEKWAAFGWKASELDGHDLKELTRAINEGMEADGPCAIVAHTVKGKGVSFMEDDNNWHYRIPKAEEVEAAKRELGLA